MSLAWPVQSGTFGSDVRRRLLFESASRTARMTAFRDLSVVRVPVSIALSITAVKLRPRSLQRIHRPALIRLSIMRRFTAPRSTLAEIVKGTEPAVRSTGFNDRFHGYSADILDRAQTERIACVGRNRSRRVDVGRRSASHHPAFVDILHHVGRVAVCEVSSADMNSWIARLR